MKSAATAIALLALTALLGLGGCVSQAAIQALEQMRAAGTITDAQYEALLGGLQQAAAWQWVENLTMVAASIMGVRLWRGPSAPPTERALRKTARQQK